MSLGDNVQIVQKVLHSVNKWLIYLFFFFFIFQLYFQVSQHKHQDNIHSSVQWKERKTGGPGVPSEACATPDLSLNNKHSRQHGSPDQPSPFFHRNYQVFKPCRWDQGHVQSGSAQISHSVFCFWGQSSAEAQPYLPQEAPFLLTYLHGQSVILWFNMLNV